MAKSNLIWKPQKADVLICVGSELEIDWLSPLIRQCPSANETSPRFIGLRAVDSPWFRVAI